MASSKRHWPSMFKSKPCTSHHQWQHDINPSHISSSFQRPPYTTGCEERSPEPKPRWNPKPEQIKILEAIFNSGMVNPPRDEIRKIRAQLQEFGQVGDANVFYWFQNRKSRSKHKLRRLPNSKQHDQNPNITSSPKPRISTNKTFSGSPTDCSGELLPEPLFSSVQQTSCNLTQGFCFPEIFNGGSSCTNVLLNEIMNHEDSRKDHDDEVKITMAAAPTTHNLVPSSSSTDTVACNINQIQDEMSNVYGTRSTVFINDVAFEVGVGPFNVRETFGEHTLLINSYGQPVLTNEWGVTLQPLLHGSLYYLI